MLERSSMQGTHAKLAAPKPAAAMLIAASCYAEYDGSMACTQFAEHRYYGESMPFPEKTIRDHMQYLTARTGDH